MYENMTYEYILQRMLSNVPDSMDKREGSIIYDAIAPAAVELTNMYIELDSVMNQTFADTARGEFLEKRCAERGITRKAATFAVVQAVFVPDHVNVQGQRFNCGEYNYTVTAATETEGVYQLTCETAGAIPNGVTGQIVPMNYIKGLKSAVIAQVLVPGEDAEADDKLRERYFTSLNSQAFGGNITDYKEKTNLIDGVGGVKVTPVWNGGGTVLLTIISSDYTAPTDTLISNVQEQMTAIAPIGHVVTVKGCVGVDVNIATEIVYQDGWSWSAAQTYIEGAIDEYFNSLAQQWEKSNNLVVRISQIETRLLACTGILDIANTTINGAASNLQLRGDQIPVRGSVSDGS